MLLLLTPLNILAQDGTDASDIDHINTPTNTDVIQTNTGGDSPSANGDGGDASGTIVVESPLNGNVNSTNTGGNATNGAGGNATVDITVTDANDPNAGVNGNIDSQATGGNSDQGNGGNADTTINSDADITGDITSTTQGGDSKTGTGGNASLDLNIETDTVGDIDIAVMAGCSDDGDGGDVTNFDTNIQVTTGGNVNLAAEGGCSSTGTGGNVGDMNINLSGEFEQVGIGALGGCGDSGGNTGDVNVTINNDTTANNGVLLANIGGDGCGTTSQGGNSGDLNLNIDATLNTDIMLLMNTSGCGTTPGIAGDINTNITGDVTADGIIIGSLFSPNCSGTFNNSDINLDVSGTVDSVIGIINADCGTIQSTTTIAISGSITTSDAQNPALMAMQKCGDFAIDVNGNVVGDILLQNEIGTTQIEVSGQINGSIGAFNADTNGSVVVVLKDTAQINGNIEGSAGLGAHSQLVFDFTTNSASEYNHLIQQLASANPAGGSITFRGQAYTWASFDELVHQLKLIEQQSKSAPPPNNNPDGFCQQAGTSIALHSGQITVYDTINQVALFTHDTSLDVTPAENMLLATSAAGHVNLYRLTSGEYQVNIGPDFESKLHTCIWTGVSTPENVKQFAS